MIPILLKAGKSLFKSIKKKPKPKSKSKKEESDAEKGKEAFDKINEAQVENYRNGAKLFKGKK